MNNLKKTIQLHLHMYTHMKIITIFLTILII